MSSVDKAQARQVILQLLEEREPGKTICPSEAARALGDEEGFRPLMPVVRDAAGELAEEGKIEATQGGEAVDLERGQGPDPATGGPAAGFGLDVRY